MGKINKPCLKMKKEIKLPDHLEILGMKWEVIRSDKVYGSFCFEDENNKRIPTITITSSKNREEVLEVLFHEVLEIIYELLRVRYTRPDCDGCYEFHYSHQQHDTACKVLAQVFKQII